MIPTLVVNRQSLQEAQVELVQPQPLKQGEIRVRVERYALTANNVTYAAFGDAMNYWGFFPTGSALTGIIPVWGFGAVIQSLHPGVAVGERLYGYWPMASEVNLVPVKLTERGFMDGADHRSALHPVYNQYNRVNVDPFYQPDTEDLQALLRPLFTTAFLIDDFFADQQFFGASVLFLSSASSKTAYATAFHLKEHTGIQVVGVTSTGNRKFCESLGCYQKVISYDELALFEADSACAFIDFAGNAEFRRQIHSRFTGLRYSCSIGGTHVEQLGSGKDLPGPKPILFFAPAQIKKRYADWGANEFGERLLQAWETFLAHVQQSNPPLLLVKIADSSSELVQIYQQVLAGKVAPDQGVILAQHPAAQSRA